MNFLRIRPEQMKMFEAEDLRRFVAAQTARVEATHGLAAERAAQVVGAAMARAKALGIDLESDVERFIDWTVRHGVGFEEQATFQTVKAALDDRSLPGWARMQLAGEALEAQESGG